jgi:hypothetical protein
MTDQINGGAPPRIDPTSVTKEAIDAAKADLRREMEVIVRERDSAVAALRVEVMSEIRRVNDVTDQKFDAVKQQFEERDTRTEQAAQESRISLDAALAAAKEAVGEQNKSNALSIAKSEGATQKQIDALVELFNTRTGALDNRVSDIKSRLDSGEGGQTGQRMERDDRRASTNLTTNIMTAGILGISAVVTVLIAVHG